MGDTSPPKPGSRALVLLLFLCSAASMAAAVRWYYLRQSSQLEAAVTRELTAIGEGKLNQIARWRRERLGDGRVLAASPLMREARRILASGTAASGGDIRTIAAALKNEFGYKDVILADREGSVFFRLEEKTTDQSDLKQVQRRDLAEDALRRGDVVFSGIN